MRWDGGQLLLSVQVTAKASSDRIEMHPGYGCRIKVTAAAQDGAANQAVCRLLAGEFDTTPGRVQVIRGHSSRSKIVAIDQPGRLPDWLPDCAT
jgi:uncharacterized protein (TIGR00251 family)